MYLFMKSVLDFPELGPEVTGAELCDGGLGGCPVQMQQGEGLGRLLT